MTYDEDAALWGQPHSERFYELRAGEVDRLTFALSDARMEIATLKADHDYLVAVLKQAVPFLRLMAHDAVNQRPLLHLIVDAEAALAKAKQP